MGKERRDKQLYELSTKESKYKNKGKTNIFFFYQFCSYTSKKTTKIYSINS